MKGYERALGKLFSCAISMPGKYRTIKLWPKMVSVSEIEVFIYHLSP